MAEADLPEGWAAVGLPALCAINPVKPSTEELPPDAPVTFVPMPAVDADHGVIASPEERPFYKVRKGYTAFMNGDVIMAKITPCMENGKAAVARGLRNGIGFGSTEFHVLRPNGAVLPDYLYRFIRQPSYRRDAESHMTGSVGQKRVPTSFLEETHLPLPPLPEQKRIVAKVEELLAHVNAARDRLARVPALLKRFRQSVLAAACSGRLTEDWRGDNPGLHAPSDLPSPSIADELHEIPDEWCWTHMDAVAEIQGGIQKQPKRAPRKHAFPYLRVANVGRGALDLEEMYKMELFGDELDIYRLQKNDLLVVEGNGSFKEIGRCAIWDGSVNPCVHQNHIIRVRMVKGTPGYANAYWNSPQGIAHVTREAVTTSGLYSLSTSKVRRIPVPIPAAEEQSEIVRRVDALFALSDIIGQRVAAATARAERLPQAILAKAFRGELVSTEAELARHEGRDYETAEQLLTRIKAAQTTPDGQTRTRRSRKVRRRTEAG